MSRLLLILFLATAASAASAQGRPPDLGRQDRWGASEKKRFLEYLRSGGGAAIEKGTVKTGAPIRTVARLRKPKFLSLAIVTDTLFTDKGSGGLRSESTAVGPQLLAGGHLFSWVRYYGGVRYTRLHQDLAAGGRAAVTHFRIPLGFEFALIPLGTPQTRYVILRGGVSLHRFGSSTAGPAFSVDLKGWRTSWDIGLGYEWQFQNSRWRAHLAGEGYRGFNGRFAGLGATLGLGYTF